MPRINPHVAVQLKAYRVRARLTQLEAATALGYDSSMFISLVECGKSRPPMLLLGKMFALYKVGHKAQEALLESLFNDFKTEVYQAVLTGKCSSVGGAA